MGFVDKLNHTNVCKFKTLVADDITNKLSQVKDAMMNTISNMYPGNLSDAKVIATMLSVINSDPTQISMNTAVSKLQIHALMFEFFLKFSGFY